MPELAEVEYYRQRWSAGHGAKIVAVQTHPGARIFRRCKLARLKAGLAGARLVGSASAGKQMLFRFSGGYWLGLHLGMSGELRVEPAGYAPKKHDHLLLGQKDRALVFRDPRMFGAVLFEAGPRPPAWWTDLPPAILSKEFTIGRVAEFLRRRARAPVKAVLLMQERFPGIGNWMADEILWRAALHPRRAAGSLEAAELRNLHRECRWVCREALARNAGRGRPLPPGPGHSSPPDLNANIPRSWLFWHRWADGGRCPRTGRPLARAEVGGRTTCWSPARQKLR